MTIRVGINGFGRIGRNVLRVISKRDDIAVVHINDLADADTLAYLLKYDSVSGKYAGDVKVVDNGMEVNGNFIKVTAQKDPVAVGWGEDNIDFVVESTGIFRKMEQCMKHIEGGAKKVLLTVPAKDQIDATIVMGVNDSELKAEDRVISNASCTTNCLAPVVKVLNDNWGIKRGFMTTVHAFTNDQRILDVMHSDLRRSRAASVNIIPTSTGAAKAIGLVIPELKGKLDGCAMRVPVPDGSIVDLVAELDKTTSVNDINSAMKSAAEADLKGILEYAYEPIVSSDILNNPHSSIFDSIATMSLDGNFVKILSWYDNEWGYSNRVVDLIVKASSL